MEERIFELQITRRELLEEIGRSIEMVAIGIDYDDIDSHRTIANTLLHCKTAIDNV